MLSSEFCTAGILPSISSLDELPFKFNENSNHVLIELFCSWMGKIVFSSFHIRQAIKLNRDWWKSGYNGGIIIYSLLKCLMEACTATTTRQSSAAGDAICSCHFERNKKSPNWKMENVLIVGWWWNFLPGWCSGKWCKLYNKCILPINLNIFIFFSPFFFSFSIFLFSFLLLMNEMKWMELNWMNKNERKWFNRF